MNLDRHILIECSSISRMCVISTAREFDPNIDISNDFATLYIVDESSKDGSKQNLNSYSIEWSFLTKTHQRFELHNKRL